MAFNLFLSVVSVCAVFAVIVLIEQMLRYARRIGRKRYCAVRHLCNFVEHNRVIDGFGGCFSPRKGSVIFHQNARYGERIGASDGFCDDETGI